MPEQSQYFYPPPEAYDIFRRLKELGDPQMAFELYRRSLQPQISASQRRIRSLTANMPGGVGLGEEAKYLAETDAGISAGAIQNAMNALQAARATLPTYGKVTTKTKTSPLSTALSVLPTVARTAVGGIVGGPTGALAGLGGYNLPLSIGEGGGIDDEFSKLLLNALLKRYPWLQGELPGGSGQGTIAPEVTYG